MIAYVCDKCGTVIERGDARYLIKSIKASSRFADPVVICLCDKCKKSWEEKIPELFDYNEPLK